MNNIYVLNTGGTIASVGKPRSPTLTGQQIFGHISIPPEFNLTFNERLPLIDSANMTYAYRQDMAEVIRAAYPDYDALIVLHGSDTLAETCAYLALIWGRYLGKPIIVLSSQQSPEAEYSDVPNQLTEALTAIRLLLAAQRGGVFTVSEGCLYHGARLHKRSNGKAAFHTPGAEPAGYLDDRNKLHLSTFLWEPPLNGSLPVPPRLNQSIMTLEVSADDSPNILLSMSLSQYPEGVILIGKGAGNIPTTPYIHQGGTKGISWVDAIREVTTIPSRISGVMRRIPVAIRSPFAGEEVDMDAYAPGAAAYQAGAFSLGSLTAAMADVKFRLALLLYAGRMEDIRHFLRQNMVGELPGPIIYTPF